ncbi:DUF885 family protein [Rhodohalobacter barkolensis]|uniref:DUF885 domain-containing protein n=1 Tax=Rhodohalobacter barkolensis TaxID=2053187 RepID=A0A2N0VFX9_9BACT|nr:DUF885 family protein [Rhodohalobacter barkolensis]PKD43094.1 hypothetical protein CWD77_10710 [Rhodohalobacter barkolensis]
MIKIMLTINYKKTITGLMALFVLSGALHAQSNEDSAKLTDLVSKVSQISVPTKSESEYQRALEAYKNIEQELQDVGYAQLGLDEQVDYELLQSHLKTNIYEIENVELYKLHPVSYIVLGATNRLFIRPGAIADRGVQRAIDELKRLPEILENGKENLTEPARVWTENTLYQIYYAKLMLQDYVPNAVVDNAELKNELIASAEIAYEAIIDFETWLDDVLLPRSVESAAWDPDHINFFIHNQEELTHYTVESMLQVALEEEKSVMAEMEALADSIHPSGDLHTVWENMKEEAPPWEGVLPMAQSFVDMASDWLKSEGDHVVTIPDYIDYGARITPPMARRTLSFGGATGGPTVAGRQSGYYILTPLEDRLSSEEKSSRIKSYNPYWTHVISYHEWLGHNVQDAAASEHVERPMRKVFRAPYFGQAWSFYLERMLEEEGYYDDRLDYITALKTRMARLQMRMWRVQRIVTKLKMSLGEMTFDEALDAYIEKIGMEPTNAFIEVQRDSQTPYPPGREIIGEMEIIELRNEYKQRMGEHYTLKNFNDNLLTYGYLTFRQIERLMFNK